MAQVGWVISFKVQLPRVITGSWHELARCLNAIVTSDEVDVIRWPWDSKGVYTVKFMYNNLIRNDVGVYNKHMESKIPS